MRLERAMTPGADARSRLNKSRPAMVTVWDHAPSRRSENCNAAVPSSFGSSQLRITLPPAMAVTRGVMLPRGGGAAIFRQLSAVIRGPDLELQPASPRIDGMATEKPKADEAWSNCLRVISIFFIAIHSPLKEGARPEVRSYGAAVAFNLRHRELRNYFCRGGQRRSAKGGTSRHSATSARRCTNRNDVGKVSFAVARKARGETRRAEILFSQARPGLKTAVRRSRDDRGAWPVAAARQSRKRPFVWTCPRRLRSGRRCLVGKMFVPHWKPVPDAVPPRSVRYAQGSTCHGTGLSPAQKRGSPARGESLQWRLAGIRFECVPAWVRRWRL